MLLEDVRDGAPCDVMIQVGEDSLDSCVAPVAILRCHPHHQLPNLRHDRGPARTAPSVAVVLPRDQLPMRSRSTKPTTPKRRRVGVRPCSTRTATARSASGPSPRNRSIRRRTTGSSSDVTGDAIHPIVGSLWCSGIGARDTKLVRIELGANPPQTCKAEVYVPPPDKMPLPGFGGAWRSTATGWSGRTGAALIGS